MTKFWCNSNWFTLFFHAFKNGISNSFPGDTFLEGLLVNGWLLKLITVQNHVEEVIAKWTFNLSEWMPSSLHCFFCELVSLMLCFALLVMFSPKGELRISACDFWCGFLSLKNEVLLFPLFLWLDSNILIILQVWLEKILCWFLNQDNASSIKVDWVPNYSELRRALDVYGYICNSSSIWASSHTGRIFCFSLFVVCGASNNDWILAANNTYWAVFFSSNFCDSLSSYQGIYDISKLLVAVECCNLTLRKGHTSSEKITSYCFFWNGTCFVLVVFIMKMKRPLYWKVPYSYNTFILYEKDDSDPSISALGTTPHYFGSFWSK